MELNHSSEMSDGTKAIEMDHLNPVDVDKEAIL
jgi:hypothetical protein